MKAIVRFVLLTALRDRLFSGIAGLIALTFGIALFLGNAAIAEQGETGLVYAAGSLRFVLILGLTIFIAFQTQRLYEAREIETILSRAVSRPLFVLSYWVGFSGIALALVIPIAATLFYVYGISSVTLIWLASLLLECLIVLAFAQFAALTLERATTTIFVTLSFYAFTRLIGFFLGIRDTTPDIGANRALNVMIDALGLVIPRLDLMTQTNWLVYGFDPAANVTLVLLQAILFICFALIASAFDLRQKQF